MLYTEDHGNRRGYSQPRSIVKIDGTPTFFNNWTVNLNSTHIADDFEIELPFKIGRNLPQAYLLNSPDYTSYLFLNSDIKVEIFVGYPLDATSYSDSDLTRIMYGTMDTASLRADGLGGEKVTIKGRNGVGLFIDNKTTQKYQNMTSSAIAQLLASNHGLKASITPTYTLAGTFYTGDTITMNKDLTEWDLLTFLAEQEGFSLKVVDDTLYFGPFDTVVGTTSTEALNYTWGQNVKNLGIDRSPHAAKNLIVEVHSFDHKKGKHIHATAKVTNTKASQSFTQRYYYPGLTMDQCQKKAESILNQLSLLEVIGEMNVSGNEKLTVDRLVYLYGTGTGLSSSYYIRKATHTFAPNSDGYRCDVSFSNLLLSDEQSGGL